MFGKLGADWELRGTMKSCVSALYFAVIDEFYSPPLNFTTISDGYFDLLELFWKGTGVFVK